MGGFLLKVAKLKNLVTFVPHSLDAKGINLIDNILRNTDTVASVVFQYVSSTISNHIATEVQLKPDPFRSRYRHQAMGN